METGTKGSGSDAVTRKKRAKIAVACNPCKTRKVRCDGKAPVCGPCSRRRRYRFGTGGDECSYPPAGRAQRYIEYLEKELQARPSEVSTNSLDAVPTEISFVETYPLNDQDQPLEFTTQSILPTPQETPSITKSPKTTSLSSSHELLRQLRDILEPESDSQPQRSFLIPSNTEFSDHSRVLPMRSVADRLIKAYWSGIHPYYPFLHRETFDGRYQALWVSADDSEWSKFYILLNVVLALGSQLESPSSCKDKGSAIYFGRAKDSSQFDPFETASLLDVQVLLLMGLYLMVDGQFSQAKRVLDVAMYSAQTLRSSFETSASEKWNEEERQIFRCVWHGGHLLSRVVSSSLGQFSQILALASTATEVPIPTCELDTGILDTGRVSDGISMAYRPSQFYSQTLRLHRILGEIYAMWNETGPTTQPEESASDAGRHISKVIVFDAKLVKYWRALPKALRHGHECAGSAMSVEHTQSCLLRTRYLYCRIMLLFPLLPFAATLSEQISGVEDDCEATIEEVLFQKLMLRGVSSARELLDLMKRLQGEKQNGSFGVPLLDYYNVCFVYTATAVISEAQKSAAVSELVGQKALDTSWEQGLTILDQTSKPKAIRCASAIQRLWQSRANESASSFEATLNTSQDDFAANFMQNEEDIMGGSLGDLQDSMLVGSDFAFDDSLEWFQEAMT